jgi:hypothetical protein
MSLANICSHVESRYIFNHDIMSCTNEKVRGNYLYSGRALGLTQVDDVIQIHPFLKQEWEAITAHYKRIDLIHTQDVIWDISAKRLGEHKGHLESLFFFGPRENKVRHDNKFYRVVEHINSKNNFVALASHLRMDIPHTQCFQGKQWLAGIKDFPYPCYLKAAVSVAGKGIFRCETPADVIKAIAHFEEDVPLQIQEEVNTDVFLNLQYKASASGLERLIATEQVLKGYTHQGNRYPASHEPWESVEPMAQWLAEKGMRNVFAFDVAVMENAQGVRFVAIECNPRFNGASYPSGVACKLDIQYWVAKDFQTQHQRISQIDLTGIEFDPVEKKGIILVNWGTVLIGKLGVLIAGSPEQQRQLEDQLRTRL